MKLGLALSSGGARGFAHIGVIKVLLKHKIKIDYISGSSMGAVVAAYFALYGNVDGIEKYVKNLRKRDVVGLIDLNNPRKSLIKGEKVFALIRRFFGDKTFKDTKIRLKIGATALETGKQVVFDKGKLVDALRISTAYPGVFPPIKYKGLHLVDGGLSDFTPVGVLEEMGAEKIIAVDLFEHRIVNEKEYDMKKVMMRTFEILISNLSKYSASDYGQNIVVLKPKTGKGVETFNFHNGKKFIKAGELEAHKNLEQIFKLLREK